MKSRISYYGPLLIIIGPGLAYLILLFTYNWYLSDNETPKQILDNMISQNGRWKTWGSCAGCFGLLLGIMSALGLLLSNSAQEYFMGMSWSTFVKDLQQKDGFPRARSIGIFFAIVIAFFILISENWKLGLRDGLNIIGVIVWVVFLVASLIFVFTLVVDLFIKKPFDFILDKYLTDDQDKV